ncbi:MAG: hypothetical protein LDL41_11015 [Coleofasciculus sp. S288]|nr:hypothetical protein [Coleofasciculus sp. S288]
MNKSTSENFVRVILKRYKSGANTTAISKFLQQELNLDPHEAARAINTHIIASKISQSQGKKLQEKLNDYEVEVILEPLSE